MASQCCTDLTVNLSNGQAPPPPSALKRAPSDPDKCYGAEVGRTSLVGYRNRSRSARSPNRRPFALRRIVPFASAPLLTASAAASAAGITCARHA